MHRRIVSLFDLISVVARSVKARPRFLKRFLERSQNSFYLYFYDTKIKSNKFHDKTFSTIKAYLLLTDNKSFVLSQTKRKRFWGFIHCFERKKITPILGEKTFPRIFFPFDKSFSGCAVAVVAVVDAAVVVAVVAAAGKGWNNTPLVLHFQMILKLG